MPYRDSGCPEKVTEVVRGAESAAFAYDGSLLLSVALGGVLDEYIFSLNGYCPQLTAFNGYGEMESLDMSIDSTPKAAWDLTFDPQTGEIEGKAEAVAGTSTTYGYDYTSLGQLEEVVKNSSIVEEYEYDANGNREYQKVNGVERWLTYDDEDHLDKIYSDAAKTVLVAEYDYDVDGFLTAKTVGTDVTTYDYSSTGELLEVVLPNATEITYSHDALGRRVAKAVDSVMVEEYLWAGMNQGLLAVYDGSDNLLLRFEYAGGRLPVAMTYSTDTYYLAYDQVGSLRAIFDDAGSLVHEITYDSFGNILSETGTFAGPVPLGFAGGLHDSDTGLVRFGYRDYDPEVGRWTAKDPIGFAGGDPNMYVYVMNVPNQFVDPTGERFGANVVGAAVSGYFSSLSDTALSVVTLGHYGQDPVSQAYMYGAMQLAMLP